MLKRLYADNFKCLVNFECSFKAEQLLLGANGSGKSTVLEVLRLIRRFVIYEDSVEQLFPTPSLTRWQTRDVQAFEIEAYRALYAALFSRRL